VNNLNFSSDIRNYLFTRIFPKLISIISIPILLRLINPTFWGEIALLVGMQAFVVSLISQGKSASMERYFTKMNRKFAKLYSLRYLYISILIFFIIFIILEVGFRLTYFKFFDLPYGLPLRFALIGSLLLAHNRFLISILRSNQESLKVLKYNQLLSISTPVTQILSIYFIVSISDFQDRMIVSAYFFAQVLILLINNVSILNFIRKNINFKTEATNDNLGRISTYSNFTYLFLIFSSLINWADRYFLKIYSSQLDVGLYDAIYRIVDILGVIVGSFMIALGPILYSRRENNKNYFNNIKYQIEFTFLLSLAGIFISPIAIEIILPSIYFSQIKIVPILLLGLAFASSASALTTIFDVNERKDLNLKGIAISATLNIILNIILIPTHGTLGAAYAMLLSSLFWFLVNSYFTRSFNFKPKGLLINIIIVSLISFIHFYLWEFSFIYNAFGIIFFLYISYRSFKIFKKLIIVST